MVIGDVGPRIQPGMNVPAARMVIAESTDVTAAAPVGVALITATPTQKKVPCHGVMVIGGQPGGAPPENVQFSFDSSYWFDATPGSAWAVNPIYPLYLRQGTGGATGTLRIDLWPLDPDKDAASIAILANALLQQKEKRILAAATGTSAANTADTITISAIAGMRLVITGMDVYTAAAATANDVLLELEDGATPIWQGIIGAGAPRGSWGGKEGTSFPITIGNDANLQIAAGGASVVTRSSLQGYHVFG